MKTGIIIIVLLQISTYSFCQYTIDIKDKVNNYLKTNTSLFSEDTLLVFAGKGTDGKYYNNGSLKNKITFISFWFVACIPCINELDELKKVYERYKTNQDFQFLSFTFDAADVTRKAIQNYKLPYTVINLTDAECTVLNFGKGYPVNMVTDKTGRIVSMATGSDISKDKDFFKNKIYSLVDSLITSK